MDPHPGEGLASRRWWRRLRGPAAGAAVLVLAAAAALPVAQGFALHLPAELPDLSAWQKVSGSAALTDGSASVTYEFYVNPTRAARYDVIRYRIVGWDGGPGGSPYRPTERLQWQAGDNDLRRYECSPGEGDGCVWRQIERNTPEYHREMPVILWVLNVHRGLLEERAGREKR